MLLTAMDPWVEVFFSNVWELMCQAESVPRYSSHFVHGKLESSVTELIINIVYVKIA